MNSTPFAWSRAFPTIFIPTYININGDFTWTIHGDITRSTFTCDKKINPNHWYEYLMWRSDGIPSSHPTFSLTLYNQKNCNSLQKQGRFVLNGSGIGINTTIN